MGYTVYKFTSPSNKVYIGITSQPVKKRWKYGLGYKRCTAMHRAIQKYGWNNIHKEILYSDLEENKAKELEIQLIKEFKSNNPKYGYNITSGGDGASGVKRTEEQKQHLREINLGKHHSDETKAKMSLTHRGNKHNLGRKLSNEHKKQISEKEKGSANPRARKVICLETLKIYDTLNDAIAETGAKKISDCCNHRYKHKSSAGLHWEYYDDKLTNDDYKNILAELLKEEIENRHRKMSENNKQKLIERSSKAVICVETGEVFKSAREACAKYNLTASTICCCCKGTRHTSGGYHWKYA